MVRDAALRALLTMRAERVKISVQWYYSLAWVLSSSFGEG
jgi:hypothetical protein